MSKVVHIPNKGVDHAHANVHKWHRSTSMQTGSEMRVIAGPCLMESVDHCWRMAEALAEIAADLSVDFFMFKASMRKENRTRGTSERGGVPSYLAGELFEKIEKTFGYPTVTDVHDWAGAKREAGASVYQIPAMLSRQSDLIETAAASRGTIHIKKGQFMAPHDMQWAVEKARNANPDCYVIVSERGSSFGYHNLVVDFRSIPIMQETSGADEVLFDCTHSVQLPSAAPAGVSEGMRELIEPLARAAIVSGADGLFCEVHDDPQNALSDGPCQIPLSHFKDFLRRMLDLYEWQQQNPLSSLSPLE